MQFDKRKSGIPPIGDLPWGSEFCQFYQTEKDLLEVIAPYLKAGLENNELCVWVPPDFVGTEAARKGLVDVVPALEEYEKKGQLELISHDLWNGGGSAAALASRMDRAVSAGFDGVRLACDVFPEKKRGATPVCPEPDVVGRLNVIAAFTYPRDEFDAIGLMEVVRSHGFALVRNSGRWEVIESTEARTVRDVLRRSEEKLQSLFSNMSEGFAYHRVVLDVKGRPCDYVFLEVNEAFEGLTGLSGEKIVGRKVTEVLPGIERDGADWIGRYGRVALTGKPATFESYSEALGRWYSVSAFSPHKGYFAVTVNDITERKRQEEALRESNRRLEILAEASRLLLSSDTPERIVRTICERVMSHLDCHVFFNYLVDEEARRLHLNACAGIPESAAREMEWLDLGAAVCGCVARDGRRIIAENIGDRSDERTGRLCDLGLRAYACHPLVDRGKTIGTLSFGTCNSPRFSDEEVELMKAVADLVATALARKRAEESIARAKEEWELTFDSVPEMIAIIDSSHRILRANEAMARRLGLGTEECVGLPCYKVVHNLSAPPAFCPHSRTICDGTEHVEEIWERGLGGDFIVSTTPLMDRDGRLIGSVHVAHDITERKKSEQRIISLNEELKQKVSELSEANAELEAFSYSVSHDLRSPLRSIDGFSQEILEDYSERLDENGVDSLRRIRAATQRMGVLMDGLLTLSRVTRKELVRTKVNMSSLAGDVVANLRKADPEGPVEVVITDGLADEGDERLLYILLQNLLENAWKFSARSVKPRVEFGACERNGRTEYFVRDNGAGFDMTYADKLFKPFQRLHSVDDFSGTGIGLATVQRIVRRHGGRVWADGRTGEGATFYFTLE